MEALSSPQVTEQVKEILIRDVGVNANVDLFAPAQDDDDDADDSEEPEEDQEGLRDALTGVVARFHTLPSLKIINIILPPKYDDSDDADTRLLQRTILQGLTAHPLQLKSLSLANIAAMPMDFGAEAEFAILLRPLTELRISTICGKRGWHCDADFAQFWEAVQTLILVHPENLTSLALHSDIEIDLDPAFRFPEHEHSNLESLSLKNIVFNQDVGTADHRSAEGHPDEVGYTEVSNSPG
ncbi:hypothetical protein DENSPDRAFT_267117 [Dentipellis sp. KUC8613]|nr:hypothetical protein DENSPDRAFT_267117 [Dentipellis sp. KUC8613]